MREAGPGGGSTPRKTAKKWPLGAIFTEVRMDASRTVTVNGRRYLWPGDPVVVICIDGCEFDYLEKAATAGEAPYIARLLSGGAAFKADCVIPAFTNPNNVSIVTGVPPAVHGICGNYFFDRDADAEVMMNDPKYMRAETILAAFADAGAEVMVVTAKDKLRRLLGKNLRGVCFSAERADEATLAENGIEGVPDLVGMPLPSVYSAELSEFVFAAGVKLMKRSRPDLMYLSTTDYVQHKWAPGSAAANAFYRMVDRYLSRLEDEGAVIAVTADHGMNAKHDAAGRPNVVYLQDLLDASLGEGVGRVILPITDPYVVHHGALGSFATIYLPASAAAAVIARLSATEEIELALDRETACACFDLPPDRTGDIVAIARRDVVLGTSAARHDLSGLDTPLRSHGGLSEQTVPLLFNRPVDGVPAVGRWRNYDVFDIALNRLVG
jgi:phosphonoacetate hydrolase